MGKRGTRLAAVVMAMGIVGSMAPAASATETLVPCETIFGEYVCNQISSTGDFVDETLANAGGAVNEWRNRVATAGKTVTDLVWCIVGGGCIAIEP